MKHGGFMVQNFNDTILKAIRNEQTTHTPLWFMRQAGRSQPEYREIKKKYSLFEITQQPELCAYVTQLPVEQYNTDAAILYKDIMSPLEGIGVDVEIKSGIGPVIDQPIQSLSDVEKLTPFNPHKAVPYVLDTIKILTTEKLNVPLIGFAGAPFTLASYMIEGGPSKNYNKTKGFMYKDPEAWNLLMTKLSDMTITYLRAQIDAGAKLIQLFDSWVGALNVQDYQAFIQPHMKRIVSEVKATHPVPIIMFGVGASHQMIEWQETGIDVVGLDWRTTIDEARNRGIVQTVQGNLDPAILLAPWDVIEERTRAILDQGLKSNQYIFNLGHGVFPEVQPATLKRVSQFVHDYSAHVKSTQQ